MLDVIKIIVFMPTTVLDLPTITNSLRHVGIYSADQCRTLQFTLNDRKILLRKFY